MDHKQLGTTDIHVPEIGLGTSAYTGGAEPLQRGVDLGASLIDTAESYGTEEAVGAAIRGIRDRVFLATKVSPEHLRTADVLRAADRSLQRMGVDWIDLYQVHWPNASIPIEETMSAMDSLVEAGKVRYVGVSNFSVAQLKEAQKALTRATVVSNQVEYSLVKRDIEDDLLSYCQENGVTVIAYSPLAEGLRNILDRDKAGVIAKIAAATGKTAAQIALNWCIAKENVIAIPKANTVAHVEEDCDASGWHLPKESLDLLDEAFR